MTISASHGLMAAIDLQIILVQDKMTDLTEKQYNLMDRSNKLEMDFATYQQSQAEDVWVNSGQMQYMSDNGQPFWEPKPDNFEEREGMLFLAAGRDPMAAAGATGPTGIYDATIPTGELGFGTDAATWQVYDQAAPAAPGGALPEQTRLGPGTSVNATDFFIEEQGPPLQQGGPPTRRLVRVPRSEVVWNPQMGGFVWRRRPNNVPAFQLGRRRGAPAVGGRPPIPNRFSGRMIHIPRQVAMNQNKAQRDAIKREEMVIGQIMKKLTTKLEMLQKQLDQVRQWLKKRVEEWFKGVGEGR